MNSFSHIVIYSFNRRFLNTYYVPGTILGTEQCNGEQSVVSLMSLSLYSRSREEMVNTKHRIPSDDKKYNAW